MKDAIKALDSRYTMKECCQAFNIPRSSLRDHYNGRIKGRKMGLKGILTKDEEEKLVTYMVEMLKLGHPLTSTDLKMKVVEITQLRAMPFKDRIPVEVG